MGEASRQTGAAGNPTMDVQCERCKTEYEFDDALVSGRGTTVRCTTCGHQFKVRRPDAEGDDAGDRWVVKTATGQQFTFLTLRELQRAILAHQVSRTDLLRRAGAAPRSLGSINELEPFFSGRTSSTRPPPPGQGSSAPNIPSEPGVPAAFPKRSSITWEAESASEAGGPPISRPTASYVSSSGAPYPPAPGRTDTLRPMGGSAAPPPAIEPQPIPMSTSYAAPAPPIADPGSPFGSASPPARLQGVPTAPTDEQSLPPPTRPVRFDRPAVDDDLPEMRQPVPSSLEEPYSMRRGRRVGGWVVALVLLLAVGVLGWALARPYLASRRAVAAPQLDPRAEVFLAEGEKAMTEGNIDQAQEALDKASALAETDPRVRLDQARVAAARADIPWLKVKVLPQTAADELRMEKAETAERVARALRLADAALSSAPDSPAAYRAKIDALRLAGQQDMARTFVTKVIAQAPQPETAYVLAALDLAEPEPLWTTVIERLRLAAGGEGNAGRARAALVYALEKSGDVAAARVELAKLDALPRLYPVSPSLHGLVDRAPGKTAFDAGLDSRAELGARLAGATGAAQVAPQVAQAAPAASGGGDVVPGDTRSAMQLAAQAFKKGDYSKARRIYEAIATRNPGDSEAIAAIGDIARAEGDAKTAIASYKRAINVNPSYLPALLGLADTQWASGDRAAAAHGYGDIVDRFPEGTYPAYVKERTQAAAASAPAEPTKATPSASAAASAPPDESAP